MIGIFDSGIGGLTILEEIKKIITHNSIIYYADSKNNPYGIKTDKELEEITSNIVDYLISKKCQVIVVACNTATTRCIKYLRNKYPNIIFIGTEPAIKIACDNNHKRTLVLGTQATINSLSVKKLIKNYKHNDQQIYLESCLGLANAIETNNDKEVDFLLDKYLSPYHDIDSIVLGCTHYPYVKNKILKYFPNSKIYDSSLGVAKELKRVLTINKLLKEKGKQDIKIIKDA